MSFVISVLLFFSSLLMLSSAIGLWRFGDTMSRLHATGKIGSLAVILVLGINLISDISTYHVIKHLLLAMLIYFTTAHSTYVISNSFLKSKKSLSSKESVHVC